MDQSEHALTGFWKDTRSKSRINRRKEEQNNMERLLFLADCHLRDRTWVNWPQLHGDAEEALKLVRKNAEGIESVLLAGDVFDTIRPSSSSQSILKTFLSAFRKVYVIAGNHDMAEPLHTEVLMRDTPTEVIRVGSRIAADTGSCYITGMDYIRNRNTFRSELEILEHTLHNLDLERYRMNYIMLHAGIKELLGIDGMWQTSVQELTEFAGNRNITFLIGHVHKNKTFSLPGGGCILSPGPLYPQNWQEALDSMKAFVLEPESAAVKSFPVDVRHYAVLAEEEEATGEALARLDTEAGSSGMLPSAVLVKAGRDWKPDVPELRNLLIRKTITDTQPRTSGTHTSESAVTLEDAVLQEIPESEPNLREFASQLMQSEDPVSYMASLMAHWKTTTRI